MTLCGNDGAARTYIRLRLGKRRGRLFELLPRSGFGLRKRLLAFLFLTRLDLLGRRGYELRFGLCDRRVLQFDLIAQIVEGRLRGGDAGLGLCDLSRVVGGVDLHQQIASLDALEILPCDRNHLAGNPAAEPRELGANIGVVGGLDRGAANPGIPAHRRQRDEDKRRQHGEQWNREAAPEAACRRLRSWRERRRWGLTCGWRTRLILLTHRDPLNSRSREPDKALRI